MLCGQVTSSSEFGVWCKNQESRLGPTEKSECWKQVEREVMSKEKGRESSASGWERPKGQKQDGSRGETEPWVP